MDGVDVEGHVVLVVRGCGVVGSFVWGGSAEIFAGLLVVDVGVNGGCTCVSLSAFFVSVVWLCACFRVTLLFLSSQITESDVLTTKFLLVRNLAASVTVLITGRDQCLALGRHCPSMGTYVPKSTAVEFVSQCY